MPGQYVALMVLCVLMVLIGLWTGWVCWGRDLKHAEANAKIMSLGYRAALRRVAEALELWEQTRCEWLDDGTQRIPLRTSMAMANALGVARETLRADSEPPNARVQAGTTAPQPDPERDEAARRGASPGTKC